MGFTEDGYYEVPLDEEYMFEITTTRGDTAYGENAEQAYAAYWQLKREAGIVGTKARIINLKTMTLVWDDAA